MLKTVSVYNGKPFIEKAIKANQIEKFLTKHLPLAQISKAFLFGSLAKEKPNQEDCDLFIIISLTPVNTDWKMFLKRIDGLRTKFKNQFGLPLNIVVNTQTQFSESSSFKTRILNKPTITIK